MNVGVLLYVFSNENRFQPIFFKWQPYLLFSLCASPAYMVKLRAFIFCIVCSYTHGKNVTVVEMISFFSFHIFALFEYIYTVCFKIHITINDFITSNNIFYSEHNLHTWTKPFTLRNNMCCFQWGLRRRSWTNIHVHALAKYCHCLLIFAKASILQSHGT